GVVVVCDDHAAAEEWADAAPAGSRAHPVTSLGRSARLLKEGAVDLLAGTPEDLQGLAARSSLKLHTVTTVVLAWPEWLLASGRLPGLEHVLGDVREARRIVLSWNPAVLEDFLERHARRPHVVGDLPLGEDARPLPPVAAARYAVVPRARRVAARREILDALDKPRVVEWRHGAPLPEAADAILCFDLPSRVELKELAARGEPVLLLSPTQLPYARTIAAPLVPVPLRAVHTRAQSRAEALRAEATTRLEAGGLEPELGLLQPLFERYDPAEVAAALLALSRQPSVVSSQPTLLTPSAAPAEEWVRVFVGVGKKDRVGARDLVGALTREVGLERDDIGRIEVRETHCLVSVTPRAAERAIAGLSRVSLRGRRVTAHKDRGV
ncbi:MAG: DbpA RNA binding domain-containing protein, partial [Gemmatimonadales bacterium]